MKSKSLSAKGAHCERLAQLNICEDGITRHTHHSSPSSGEKLGGCISHVRQAAYLGLAAMTLTMLAHSARASNLVTNGEFTSGLSTSQSIYEQVTPWVVSADNARVYLYLPNTATTTGADYNNEGYQVVLTGTGDDSDPFNGNGNFVGIDSGFGYSISQTISGLLPNTTYELSFDTAAAQQTIASGGTGGATTDYWEVSLGGQTEYLCAGGSEQSTPCNSAVNPLFSIVSQGFSGWVQEEMTFTTPATLVGNSLTFLAVGSPGGEPPFTLLDSVGLQQTPEPGTCALLGAALLGVGILRRRRSKRA